MRLIDDWQRIALKLWSVRLALIGALLSAVAAGVSVFYDGKSWPVSMIVFGVNLAAAWSRVIAQPGLFEGENGGQCGQSAE